MISKPCSTPPAGCAPARDIHFMFIGAGPKWQIIADYLRQEAPGMSPLPWQSEAVVPLSLATADVAMYHWRPARKGWPSPAKPCRPWRGFSLAGAQPQPPAICSADRAVSLRPQYKTRGCRRPGSGLFSPCATIRPFCVSAGERRDRWPKALSREAGTPRRCLDTMRITRIHNSVFDQSQI